MYLWPEIFFGNRTRRVANRTSHATPAVPAAGVRCGKTMSESHIPYTRLTHDELTTLPGGRRIAPSHGEARMAAPLPSKGRGLRARQRLGGSEEGEREESVGV